jgi:hypothetical protein
VLEGSPASLEQALLAACLWAGPKAWISHRTAAFLHQLEGLQRWPGVTEITSTRRLRHDRLVMHHTRQPRGRPVFIRGVPVSPLAWTVLEVAAGRQHRRAVRAVEDAILQGRVDRPALEPTFSPERKGVHPGWRVASNHVHSVGES